MFENINETNCIDEAGIWILTKIEIFEANVLERSTPACVILQHLLVNVGANKTPDALGDYRRAERIPTPYDYKSHDRRTLPLFEPLSLLRDAKRRGNPWMGVSARSDSKRRIRDFPT